MAEAFHMQRGVRQQSFRGRRNPATAADQWSEIGKSERSRGDRTLDERYGARDIDAQVAVQIAFADGPGKMVEPVERAVANERPGDAIGRRTGKGQLRQIVQIRQVATGDRRGRRIAAELKRVGNLSMYNNMGGTGPDISGESVRMRLVNMNQRAAMNVGGEGFCIEGAVAEQLEGAIGPGACRLLRKNRSVEGQATLAVVDRHAAIVQDEATDRRNVPALRTVRGMPVGAAVGLADNFDGGV